MSEMESKFQKFARLLRHGRHLFSRSAQPLYFHHMPTTILRGLWGVAQNKAAVARIESGFYKDNLIVVVGIAKAGTKSVVRALRTLQDSFRPAAGAFGPISRPMLMKGRYFTSGSTADLQIEIAVDVLDGGVVHTHSAPNYRSLYVFERLNCKYLVLLRHPLSRLAPIYCACLQGLDTITDRSTLPRYFLDAIHPIRSDVFDGNRNTDEVMRYLITEGYLEASLEWMARWLELRDPEKSIVVRHEDVVDRFETVLQECSRFFFGRLPESDLAAACRDTYDEDIRPASYCYPRGWPGTVAASRTYVNAENRALYRKIVTRFIDTSPGGARLLGVYPDIAEA